MTTATDDELCYLSIADLGRGYRSRDFSPHEVTAAYLRRIEALEPRVRSYLAIMADHARAAASSSERRLASGQAIGQLDGIPIGLKDVLDTAGISTTGGSAQYADRVPSSDATVVRRLNDAGAVLLGKQALYELAGTAEVDSHFPAARNPWDLRLTPGGSSSGSAAALAAGLCAGAVGTDTGGSIRGPASYCGVVGLKPSAGLVSRMGVLPFSWSLDCVGPMTRTVEDNALLLQVMAGYDPLDPGSERIAIPDFRAGLSNGIQDLRIGAPLAFVETAGCADDTLAAYRAALDRLQRLGAKVQSIEMPEVEHAAVIGQVLGSAEAFAFHARNARERPDRFGQNFYARLLEGAVLTASDYVAAQRGRDLVSAAMAGLMRSVDLIALPTTAQPARTLAEEAGPRGKRASFNRLFSVSGQPALSVPCGFSTNGLPIGLQLAGPRFADAAVLAAASAYERGTNWGARRPAIASRDAV